MQIIPRDNQFYDLFAQVASRMSGSATLLHELFKDPKKLDQNVAQIKTLEHEADNLTHDTIDRINRTFVTPFDREDIHALASSLDDVLDYINGAASRMVTYKISNPPAEAIELAGVILRQAEELGKALAHLEKGDGVLQYCVEVNRLENEADAIARAAIGRLFETELNPIQLIKHKELLEVMEIATDKAEDAANVLETVVLKSA